MELPVLAELMVKHGADLGARDTLGRPALHLALLHRMLPLACCAVKKCAAAASKGMRDELLMGELLDLQDERT